MSDNINSNLVAYELGKSFYDNQEVFNNLSSALEKSLISAIKANQELQQTMCDVISQTLSELISLNEDLLRISVENMTLSLDAIAQAARDILADLEDSEDYVVIDETVLKEIDISENITIPIGNKRVRMKTSDFIALLAIIIPILLSTIGFVSNRIDTASDSRATQQIIELEKERNQMFYSFFTSIDASESSQAESIEELKESVLNLHSEILELKDILPVSGSAQTDPVSALDQAPETQNNNPE